MARKSGPSILQEELYPSAAERGHDDLLREAADDARLVDLDVDEESPFLRAQKRVPARRSSLPKKTANRLLWGFAAAAGLCVMAFGAAWLYHYGERSWRFRVESSDNIEVSGMQNVTKTQIMEVMGADIGRNIFFVPLAQQKAQLEQIPWVESASVMRFVPNRLTVQIHERMPVAFARVGEHIFLIDAAGTLMDLSAKHKYSFPVILGMNPGEPLSTRAPRMKAYMEMLRQLDSGGAHYSQDLSEVDLSDLEDVKVRVNDPAGDVLVHLGSSDFLQRFQIYVSHARAWRQQFQKLESVDLRYDNQIIVNPDMERPSAGRGVPLNPASAKVAAAAGVKPAALLTRTLPHERAVPKPAFELTEKKLKAATADKATNKKTAKTRARAELLKFGPVSKAGSQSSARTTPTIARQNGPTFKRRAGAKAAAKPNPNPAETKPAADAASIKPSAVAAKSRTTASPSAPIPNTTAKPGARQKPSAGIAKNDGSDGPAD